MYLKQDIAGWGRYPVMESRSFVPATMTEALAAVASGSRLPVLARGMGRSYGDSSLAETTVDCRRLDTMLQFDRARATLSCAAGVTLADILKVFVPRGFFLSVTPGTKHITVGGAIASDVHGKNHHKDGTFCDHLESMRILLGTGEVVTASRTSRPELFHATCGGMGLTGIILEATIRLVPIASSHIDQTIIKTQDLQETLEAFERYDDTTYSVAWIDCLSRGSEQGRSLVMLGEHASSGGLSNGSKRALQVPTIMPGVVNRQTVSAFNTLYYHRIRNKVLKNTVHYEPFFYPLDGIGHANRLYGKGGFTQYQFVIPKQGARQALSTMLDRIALSGHGPFLSVLKAFGPQNDNHLSFPFAGYTLAMDFIIKDTLFPFLDDLDEIVLEYGGRLYLTKDARMSRTMFEQGYPRLPEFLAIRRDTGAAGVFESLQSKRLGM